MTTTPHPDRRRRAGRRHHGAGAGAPGPAGARVRGRSRRSTTCRARRPRMPRRWKCWRSSAWSTRSSRAGWSSRCSASGTARAGQARRRVRFRPAQGRDALSVRRAMRAAQARRHGDRAAARLSRTPRSNSPPASRRSTQIRRRRRDRGRDRRRHAQDRGLLPDRRRRRTLDRAQGARHRVRGLHPSRALHDPDHDRSTSARGIPAARATTSPIRTTGSRCSRSAATTAGPAVARAVLDAGPSRPTTN